MTKSRNARLPRLIFHWKVKVNLRPKSKSERRTKKKKWENSNFDCMIKNRNARLPRREVNFTLESESKSQTKKQKWKFYQSYSESKIRILQNSEIYFLAAWPKTAMSDSHAERLILRWKVKVKFTLNSRSESFRRKSITQHQNDKTATSDRLPCQKVNITMESEIYTDNWKWKLYPS